MTIEIELQNPMNVTGEERKLILRSRQVKQHEEYQYLHLLEDIMENGVRAENRTGIDTLSIPHYSMSFDMSKGYPLLTTKKMAFKTMKVELEGFIKGVTSKSWFQERGCKIWNEWCNPQKVPYGHDEETKKKMYEEDDLGPIYGYQWRNFNGTGVIGTAYGCDQLSKIVDTLKKNPTDRRMVCSAFNPLVLHEQALPPCHLGFIVNVLDNKLNLSFQMRSVDVPLGMPFNISSYALLLHLLAKESGFEEGQLTGFFNSVHIYVNQIDGIKKQLTRTPFSFPKIKTDNFKSIFTWEHQDSVLEDYQSHDSIKMPIAV